MSAELVERLIHTREYHAMMYDQYEAVTEAADLIEAQAAEIMRLREVLRAFTDCARYDPHMDGSSSFMGWRHSELRRVEELARATLAALENKP